MLSKSSLVLEALPEEILRIIITYLNGSDVAKLAQISKYFNALVSDDLTWKQVIYYELTNHPQLICGENYYDFYKRHFLGVQKIINSLKIDKSDIHHTDKRCHYYYDNKRCHQPRTSWVYIDQFYPYQRYKVIEYKLPSNSFNNYFLKFFLFNAARNNLEVWANQLCKQIIQYLDQKQIENIYLESLCIATGENSHLFIQALLHNYIQNFESRGCQLFDTLTKTHIPLVWKIFHCISFDSKLIRTLSQFLHLLPLYDAIIANDFNSLKNLLNYDDIINHLWRSVPFCIIYYISLCGNLSCMEYILPNFQHFFSKCCEQDSKIQRHSDNMADSESKWEKEMIRTVVDRNGYKFLELLRKMSSNHLVFKHYYCIAFWHIIYRTIVDPASHPGFFHYITLECNQYHTFYSSREYRCDKVEDTSIAVIFRACYKLMEDYDGWKEKDEIIHALTGLQKNNCILPDTHHFWKNVLYQLESDLPELDNPLCREYEDYYFCHDIYNLIILIKDLQITPPELFRKLRIIESKNEISNCLSLFYTLNNLQDEKAIYDWVKATPGYHFEELTLRVGKLYLKKSDFDSWLLYGVNRLIKKIRSDQIQYNHILRHKIKIVTQCYFDLYLSHGFDVNKCVDLKQIKIQRNLPSISLYDSKCLDLPVLHYACKLATPIWVEILLMAGADRQFKNYQDKLPIEYCQETCKNHDPVNIEITIDLLKHYTHCPLRAEKA